MPTLLADPPAAPPGEQPLAPETPATPPEPAAAAAAERKCEKCGTALQPGQEWCLNCGAGVPGSLETHSPSWRSTAVIITLTTILALVAAGAAYAALNKKSVNHHVIVAVVPPAASTPATATTPATAGTTASSGATTSTPTTTTAKAVVPLPVKPPKIPLTATPAPKATTPAPKPAATSPAPAKTIAPSAPPAKTEPAPTPILLDTNAVSTYNPNNFPAENFGDPSLTIDGDSATGWSARVEPSIAPGMAVGLAVNLGSAQKLSALQLITSTPGITVQVFGAKTTTVPATITSPEWTKLTQPKVVKARHTRIKLANTTSAFSLVLLWISAAPASSVGTPETPGRVSVNEIELLPAK